MNTRITETTENAKQAIGAGIKKVEHATDKATRSLDDVMTRVGETVEHTGGSIEAAGRKVGRSVASAGEYLQKSHPDTVRADLMEVMRRHPGTTLCIGIGAGIVVGRLLLPRGGADKRTHG